MNIMVLDFEGSLKNGIREIGSVFANDSGILSHENVVVTNHKDCIGALYRVLSNKPNLFVSHNVHVEKNLLKKYLPYDRNKKVKSSLEWGPWLDTKEMYNILYPDLIQYDLKYLTENFIKKEVQTVSNIICLPNKSKPHFALYDAICAYLLFKRIKNKINISKFIQ